MVRSSRLKVRKSGIYKITCVPTGKVYIGSAFDFVIRRTEHKYHLRRGNHHNQHLQNAWNKYGEFNFSFELIGEYKPDDLKKQEQYWVDFYQSANPELGFNIAAIISAPMAGRNHSPETRKKISESQKGIPVPSRRHKRSPESIEKTIAAHRGKKRSPEACLRIRNGKKGKPVTPAQKLQLGKLADLHRGKPLSIDHRTKLSAVKMGKPGKQHTDESRAKMSVSQRKRPPVSDETKRRMSAARKAYWDRKKSDNPKPDDVTENQSHS